MWKWEQDWRWKIFWPLPRRIGAWKDRTARWQEYNRRHFKKHHPKVELTKDTKLRVDLLAVLFVAYMWETLEHYLEEGLAGQAVALWFQGVEFWPNRFISDPLMLVFGYWIATRYPGAVWPARGFSAIWLVVHIFLFPDSMYLHHYF